MDEAKSEQESHPELVTSSDGVLVGTESPDLRTTSYFGFSVEEPQSITYQIPPIMPTTLSSAFQIYQPLFGGGFTSSFGLVSPPIPQLGPSPALFPCDGTAFLSQGIPQIVPNTTIFPYDGNSLATNGFSADSVLPTTPNTVLMQKVSRQVPNDRRSQFPHCHENARCSNCETTTTSLWRRNERGEVECNACNLYYRKNKRPRPLSLCRHTITKRNRKTPGEHRKTKKSS